MAKTVADLDRIDKNILRLLQKQGRMPNVELAQSVNLSPTPCLERVRKLERDGFIIGYVALADPVKLNAGLSAYIQISLTNTTTKDLNEFNAHMTAMEEVQECHMVAGGFDYLIKIRVADMQHYQRFLGEKLATTPGISQTHTYVVIQDVKSETAITIPS
jgi:Lrp/AsnC family transcriptional regulator, leucine-responsive regulatory protein